MLSGGLDTDFLDVLHFLNSAFKIKFIRVIFFLFQEAVHNVILFQDDILPVYFLAFMEKLQSQPGEKYQYSGRR